MEAVGKRGGRGRKLRVPRYKLVRQPSERVLSLVLELRQLRVEVRGEAVELLGERRVKPRESQPPNGRCAGECVGDHRFVVTGVSRHSLVEEIEVRVQHVVEPLRACGDVIGQAIDTGGETSDQRMIDEPGRPRNRGRGHRSQRE
jgi:hypothetical protein